MVACHPSYMGRVVVQDSPGRNVRPYFKNNESKKGWGQELSDRAPAWQAQGPELNPNTTKQNFF
jgi:hypothetical protein